MPTLLTNDFVPYEPKKVNRFILTLPELFDINEWAVRSVELPSYDMFSGWNPMEMRFVDPVGPSTSQKLWNLFLASTGTKDGPIYGLEKLSDSLESGFTVKIELIDPTGQVVSVWILTGCRILEIDFGNLDYAESDVITCGMTIKPREASLLY